MRTTRNEEIEVLLREFFHFGQTRTDTLTFWYDLFQAIAREGYINKEDLTKDIVEKHVEKAYNDLFDGDFFSKICEKGHGDCGVECIYAVEKFCNKIAHLHSVVNAYTNAVINDSMKDSLQQTEEYDRWAWAVRYSLHLLVCKVKFHSKSIHSEPHYALALKPKNDPRHNWLIVDLSLTKWFDQCASEITNSNDGIYTAMGTDLFFKWNQQEKDDRMILVTCKGKLEQAALNTSNLDAFRNRTDWKEQFFEELLTMDKVLELRLKTEKKLKVVIDNKGFFVNYERVDAKSTIASSKTKRIHWSEAIPDLGEEKQHIIDKVTYLSTRWELIQYVRTCLKSHNKKN